MPNKIAADKRSVTYLERLDIWEWMVGEAAKRKTEVSAILREATSSYYAQERYGTYEVRLLSLRTSAKSEERAETMRKLVSGESTSKGVEKQHAPIERPVPILGLRESVRRAYLAEGLK